MTRYKTRTTPTPTLWQFAFYLGALMAVSYVGGLLIARWDSVLAFVHTFPLLVFFLTVGPVVFLGVLFIWAAVTDKPDERDDPYQTKCSANWRNEK